MRGVFQDRGLLDGMGSPGFDGLGWGLPGFVKDAGKAAASYGAGKLAGKLKGKGGGKGAPPPPPPPAGMSTGAKVAIVVLGGIVLATRSRRKR